MSKKWVLVIHGGAGNVPSVDAKKEIKAKEKLNQALLYVSLYLICNGVYKTS